MSSGKGQVPARGGPCAQRLDSSHHPAACTNRGKEDAPTQDVWPPQRLAHDKMQCLPHFWGLFLFTPYRSASLLPLKACSDRKVADLQQVMITVPHNSHTCALSVSTRGAPLISLPEVLLMNAAPTIGIPTVLLIAHLKADAHVTTRIPESFRNNALHPHHRVKPGAPWRCQIAVSMRTSLIFVQAIWADDGVWPAAGTPIVSVADVMKPISRGPANKLQSISDTYLILQCGIMLKTCETLVRVNLNTNARCAF